MSIESIKASNCFEFYVNSEQKQISSIDPSLTLLEYLRENDYFGTKYGCGEGGCGACTVVIAEFDRNKNQIKYRSANACLVPICAVANKQVITIEGIGDPNKPHPIQERMAKGNASQCGFCTPGIVMSLYSYLKINPSPSMSDIEESFDGNLCRCTGYRPILDSAKSFSHDFICDSKLIDFSECKPYDASKMEEPKFPSRLVELSNRKESLLIEHNDITWYEPKTLDELLFIKEKFPESKLVGGNSEIGVEIKFKGMDYKHFVNISNLDEMKKIQIRDGCLEIGVNTTLTDLIDKLNMCKRERMFKSYELSVVDALLSNLRWFASRQIRNFATLAGNITTGSPISDLNPIFVCTDSTLDIFSKENGLRSVSMRKFFLAYRKIDLKPNEVALRVKVPLPRSEFEIVHAYKQAKRKDDDIACVNGCFRILLNKTNENTYEVKNLDLSFGGLAPTTIYLSKINESIRNAQFSRETLSKLEEMLLECVNLSYSVPGAMPTYRRALAASFVRKFWLHVDKNVKANLFTEKELRNIEDIEREVSSGSHDFGTRKIDPHLATTYSHMSALKQTTGVAKYVDDIPKLSKELYAYPVMSKRAHAKILSVCADKALEIKGVRAFISHKDIPHENVFGLGHDEQFLPTDTVYFYGQIIGLIVAESKNLAKKASRLVEIEYETLPAILTIEDAIEKSSFFDGYEKYIKKGQFDEKTFVIEQEKIGEEFVFEGTCRIGGQEHFYLETQGSLVIPKENDELEIIAATQNPSEIQGEIARVLGIPMNKVVCKVKRIGGGFGGKETRATLFAVINAVAAFKLNCPVRFIVDRDVDMMTSGGRHPVLANYKVRIDKQGFFKAYHLDFVANGGFSLDLSSCVLDRFQNHVDNVYNFENIKVTGRIAKTNIASNTAFRGFGAPQAMFITESMISECADRLNIDQAEIREKNMYKALDTTYFAMKLDDWFIPEMWHQLLNDTKYHELRKEVDEFNSNNKWKKRGMSVIPTKYGLGFGIYLPQFNKWSVLLNQAAAQVNIYTDGTVLVSIHGVEMGQGLHTKVAQLAANQLGISMECVYVSETSTEKNPNGSPTAGSVSSDLYGMAVFDACKILNERLKPYRDANPNATVKEIVMNAYLDRVNLSAIGFYKNTDIGFDWQSKQGKIYHYFTLGVALSIVELDVLTGDHTVLRTDIIMDIGQSINFAIDVGQIEGAFVQGLGLFTLEESLHQTSDGSVFTRGPGNYKIPAFRNVPVNFNIKILRDKDYKALSTIKSSKGIGEPPLFLASSVFFALRDAISYARKENGIIEPLVGLQSPCTPETLRLACEDDIVQKSKVIPKQERSFDNQVHYEKLWAVRS